MWRLMRVMGKCDFLNSDLDVIEIRIIIYISLI